MGIFGLTSYISEHSSEYLVDHKLHDCSVLIDGNAAASLIYSHYTKCIHAFGGDYDKFAHCVVEFITLLRKCNIVACFIFDGGYEKRKLKTVIERLKLNIVVCSQFKKKYRESKCFPLLLREVFKDVLRNNDVPVIQCDFEADQELVILARLLNCPVISNDSDFYISDVAYIPFSALEFKAYRINKKIKDKFYIRCKLYRVDNLLNKFEGLSDKSLLPLMSCVLGNDYIPPRTFKNFLGITPSSRFPKRIEKILEWLRGVLFADFAIEQLVKCVPKKQRSNYRKLIQQLHKEFNCRSSQLLEYIPDSFHINCEIADAMNNLSVTENNEDVSLNMSSVEFEIPPIPENEQLIGIEEDSFQEGDENIEIIDSYEYEIDDESDIEEDKEEELSINTSNNLDSSSISNNPITKATLPEWAARKFRLGLLSPTIINIHNFKRIIIQSQSEDYYSPPSHLIINPILQVVISVVLGKEQVSVVKCHARLKSTIAGIHNLSPLSSTGFLLEIPSLEHVVEMSEIERQVVLLKCLNISENIDLKCFPNEWRIFVIAMLYWLNNCKNVSLNQTYARSVVLCLIYLGVIDKKIGYVRTQAELNRLSNLEKKNRNNSTEGSNSPEKCADVDNSKFLHDSNLPSNTSELVNTVSKKDCITAAMALLHYHHLDNNLLQNRKNFDTKLVHVYAQLQHCLQAVSLLNSVLNFPFDSCPIYEVFSGTFLYNFYNDMYKRKLADGYITRTLLSKATDVIFLYRFIMKFLTCVVNNIPDSGCSNSEKKKKKSRSKNILKPVISDNKVEENEESFVDSENIYSLLLHND